MPVAPQSWAVLQAIQYRIWNEVKVGGVSPFTPFIPGDQAKYGGNPQGTIANAVYIGVPKDWNITYTRQCHVIPFMREDVSWRALGGKVWDDADVYVRYCFNRVKVDWYQTEQDLINARDATYVTFAQHAELPFTPIVRAVKPMQVRQVPAYHHDEVIGRDWDCWGFLLHI